MTAGVRTLRAGRYTLNRTIGSGAQAETFEARDHGSSPLRPAPGQLATDWERFVARGKRGETPNAHGLVAIKSFHVGRAKAWKDVELAEREARTLAALDHPNLPRYIEHFEEDGALYLVMEMVEGESLAKMRADRRVSSVTEVTKMLTDIGDALRYLHGRAPAVVHRDIKPGNIIRRDNGSYALVDFGAVRDRLKPEGGSTVVGTFGFMAPEQFQGRASPKSDLYGLAATALVMLTGTEPEDLPHVGLGIDVRSALPKSIPEGLVRALSAMLHPDPDRRAGSIDEALAYLRTSNRPPPALPPEAPPPPSAKPLSRREERRLRREERVAEYQQRRAAKRQRRLARRSRSAPFVPRVVGQLVLVAARLVVALAVGALTPLLLAMLSLIFGASLRRAAVRVRGAAARADRSLAGASAWLGGSRAADELPTATPTEKLRVEGQENRLRVPDAPTSDRYAEWEEPEEEQPRRARRR